MDFAFTDEQEMIADTVRAFFAENATSERTRKAMDSDGFDRELWSSLGSDLGMLGVALPETVGGAGLGMVEMATLAEAAGARVAALPLLGQAMAGAALVAGGMDEQQSDTLPRVASGETICTVSLGGAALEVAGDTLTGTLKHVPHGHIADVLLVIADDTCWLVRMDQAGASARMHVTLDQTRPLSTVTLEQVAAQKLADSEKACKAALASGLIVLSAEALGGAQEALDRTVAYSKDRVQFGRPIGSFQAYKHRLADMMVAIEQARSAVYWAACAVDEESDEASIAVHSAKAFCADTFAMVAGNMIQLHGGIGFTWEHDAHLFFKRARSISTLLHDGDWHRERVAVQIMGEAA